MTSDQADAGGGAVASPGSTAKSGITWVLAPSFTAAVAVGVIFAAAGLLLARVDLVLLALPLIIAVAWAWDRQPREARQSEGTVDLDSRANGAELGFVLALTPPDGAESISVRLATLDGRPQETVVSAEAARELRGRIPVLHSGPQQVLRVEHRLFSADAAWRSLPQDPLNVKRVIPPPYTAVSTLPLPRRLLGLTGTHDSSRPGDGGDFRDVHPFTTGDRLRRIDWKTTARRGRFVGDLYVRRTAATADATVLIVLDSHGDVGEQVAEWSRNRAAEKGVSSLDLAREAASSLAAGYIRAGDRVGFQDLASQRRMIAHGGGSRHLRRLLRAAELVEPSDGPSYRQRPPIVPPGALIYVLSTFLSEEAGRMAALWRESGHRVIAVDVLPAPRFTRTTRGERLAYRIMMMERSDRVHSLEAQGVEILRWPDDEGSELRETRLRILSRPARSAR